MINRVRTLFLASALVAASTVGIASDTRASDGFIHFSGTLAPLANSHTYMLAGTRTSVGCHYHAKDVMLSSLTTEWEVRDIAINPATCRKLVEEGIPTQSPPEQPLTTEYFPVPTEPSQSGLGGPSSPDYTTHTSRYYQRNWWEDIIGKVLNADTTRITWTWDGTCALTGTVDQIVEYSGPTGWSLEAHNGYRSLSCTYLYGNTTATFKNSFFCWPLPTTWTYYYHNRVYGRGSGAVTLSYDSNTVDSCAPVWEHRSYGTWSP